MLLGGDEFRRTQRGNNNAYCQDNETSWYDWSFLEQHQEMFRFTRGMIAFRQAHRMLSAEEFYTDAEIHWFSPHGDLPHWTDPKEKQLACLIHESDHQALYFMFNASAEAVTFHLPPIPNGARWHLAVDTSHEAPQGMFGAGDEPLLDHSQVYHLRPRSSVILVARPPI